MSKPEIFSKHNLREFHIHANHFESKMQSFQTRTMHWKSKKTNLD